MAAPRPAAPAASALVAASAPLGPPSPRAGAANIPLSGPPEWQVAGVRANHERESLPSERARGLPGWLALGVLIVIAGIGGLIDTLSGSQIRGAFAVGLIAGALVAILAVRRTEMFAVVVAPPLVYFLASAAMLYLRSGGLSNRKVLIDAAANWLVYGFPAIAGATAVVLIIAGLRLILRR